MDVLIGVISDIRADRAPAKERIWICDLLHHHTHHRPPLELHRAYPVHVLIPHRRSHDGMNISHVVTELIGREGATQAWDISDVHHPLWPFVSFSRFFRLHDIVKTFDMT
ncbi:hypothetical protein WA026_012007 [Henosepilachna vigintioctopunctata]|uniref:Uncharacterized protein n=1 Tax=Henosepilachna vigintioctopunctata TaxID=420089 RepID=A0AAW1V6C6_9CUCU